MNSWTVYIWTDGHMYRWTFGQVYKQTNGQKDRWTYEQDFSTEGPSDLHKESCKYGQMNSWKDGHKTNGQTDIVHIDRQTDIPWTDRKMYILIYVHTNGCTCRQMDK